MTPRKTPIACLLAVISLLSLTLTSCVSASSAESSRPVIDPRPPAKAGAVDCRQAKCIALTFDGGPGARTPELLDTLKREEVHATFFLLGRGHIERYPDVVKRIADEGHEVANHTWTHRRMTAIPPSEVYVEFARTQEAIRKITGRTPTLMRPPGGYTDSSVGRVARSLGLSQILWTITAKDYTTKDPAVVAQRVLDQVDRDGIILLHDIYQGTVPAVPAIIAGLKQRGFTLVTVPELFAPHGLFPGRVYKDAWTARD